MNLTFTKVSVCIALSLALTACGGSDDTNKQQTSDTSQIGEGSKSGLDSSDYVKGEFAYVNNDPSQKYVIVPHTETNNWNSFCGYPYNVDTKFETDNVIILGSRNHLPESDFIYAASLVEKALPIATKTLGFTPKEIQEMHPYVTITGTHWIKYDKEGHSVDVLGGMDKLINEFSRQSYEFKENNNNAVNQEQNALFVKNLKILGLDSNEINDENFVAHFLKAPRKIQKEIYESLIKASDDFIHTEIIRLKQIPNPDQSIQNQLINYRSYLSAPTDIRDTTKTLVCLNEQMDQYSWGTGGYNGFDVKPKSYTLHDLTDRVDLQTTIHELIHYIQVTVGSPLSLDTRFLPKWMVEGTAGYFSGQPISNKKPYINPFLILTDSDQQNYYNDLGEAYAEYNKAVQYTEKHKLTSFKHYLLEAGEMDIYMNTFIYSSGVDRKYESSNDVINKLFKDNYGQDYKQMTSSYQDVIDNWK